jgi:hypothetical protein
MGVTQPTTSRVRCRQIDETDLDAVLDLTGMPASSARRTCVANSSRAATRRCRSKRMSCGLRDSNPRSSRIALRPDVRLSGAYSVRLRCAPKEHLGNRRACAAACAKAGPFAMIEADVTRPAAIKAKICSLTSSLVPRSSAFMISNIVRFIKCVANGCNAHNMQGRYSPQAN